MLNPSSAKRDRQVYLDDRIKRTFELILYSKLLRIFRNYHKLYFELLLKGKIANTVIFKDDLKSILNLHYSKVSEKFSTRIVDRIGIPVNHREMLRSLRTRTGIHSQLRAEESSTVISSTTLKEAHNLYHKSKQNILAAAAAAGLAASRTKIAEEAAVRLMSLFRQRIGTISSIETQNIAEFTKNAELEYLHKSDAEIDGIKLRSLNLRKSWSAILDNRTRPDHAAANGQTVAFDQPFEVGGELLMFPGDTSLGASIENIANCRCSLVQLIT